MKLFNSKPTIALVLSIFTACASMSSVYADNFLSGAGGEDKDLPVAYPTNMTARFNELNEKYLGNGGDLVHASFSETHYIIKVPGYQKRPGVFKFQKLIADYKKGPREDLVFDSKEDALGFCDYLFETAQKATSGSKYASIHISDTYAAPVRKAIAVPYWIDYDEGSEPTADGKSTPAQKHVMCPNWKGWALDSRWNDENESTGVKKSEFDNVHYDVECVADKPATSFYRGPAMYWTNGSQHYVVSTNNVTLHQLNEQVGAKYCSPD